MKTMMVATSPNYKYLFLDEKFKGRVTHKVFNETFTEPVRTALFLTEACVVIDPSLQGHYTIDFDVNVPTDFNKHTVLWYSTQQEFDNVCKMIKETMDFLNGEDNE